MKFIVVLFLFISSFGFSQEEEKKEKELNESKNLTWEGNKNLANKKFAEAEVAYRKAISKSDENAAAPFNLGNAYYNNETYSEAFGRFKQAGETATEKKDKHMAYHNMGNVFMKRKEYEKAVEAYKEALRNNPTDEETRYNLALAKDMLKKEQDEQKNEDKNKEDKDEKKDQDKKDDNKEGDNEDENKDKKDGEKGKDKKEDGDKGKKDDKKEQEDKKPEQGNNEKDKKQPRPNQLSKQQIQNLLEAMQNEEKKVQQKIDKKKVKGVKLKNQKDW